MPRVTSESERNLDCLQDHGRLLSICRALGLRRPSGALKRTVGSGSTGYASARFAATAPPVATFRGPARAKRLEVNATRRFATD